MDLVNCKSIVPGEVIGRRRQIQVITDHLRYIRSMLLVCKAEELHCCCCEAIERKTIRIVVVFNRMDMPQRVLLRSNDLLAFLLFYCCCVRQFRPINHALHILNLYEMLLLYQKDRSDLLLLFG